MVSLAAVTLFVAVGGSRLGFVGDASLGRAADAPGDGPVSVTRAEPMTLGS